MLKMNKGLSVPETGDCKINFNGKEHGKIK